MDAQPFSSENRASVKEGTDFETAVVDEPVSSTTTGEKPQGDRRLASTSLRELDGVVKFESISLLFVAAERLRAKGLYG